MKIVGIKAAGLRGATPAGGWEEELTNDDVVHTLISVHTEDGLIGVGSVFTSEALVKAALELLTPYLIGENALEPERVAERLHRTTFWMGRGGSVTHTISGIDTALWDILGQATGQPVGRLLGGRYREKVRAYASLLMQEPIKLSEHLTNLKSRGWTAFKIGWGPFGRVSAQLDEAIVAAAREAVGPDALLMVDAGASDSAWSNGYKWALKTSHMLEHYNVEWFEEPLPPDALEDFVALRRAAPVAISGGEVLTRRQTFVQWLDRGAFDIVQPDVTKVGGLSEQRRIGWAAQDHGIKLIPHGWNTALGLAADLQLASALPETDLIEYVDGSPYVDDIVTTPWALDTNGLLTIPESPGLGASLDPEAVKFYTHGVDIFTL
ncbi:MULTISPECIES: mandelate racemase/muconate lactonizing enzyme family protein [Micrococcaceae]|uniref:mandelate racemase/muconate lactonizing enzyme family protein n=1 Tax=Micrococcaceae TaxID=1268 RepID=UPI0002EBD855|nr:MULTISPECIES: mandelate racemase/muconate lactonizing enzyme family protein [Micrococcaceae]MBP2269142.1 L-alanine-DL-glutamate epimerase-like enolase superfamily enzyme [Pseudarthrobacter sp. PvP004]